MHRLWTIPFQYQTIFFFLCVCVCVCAKQHISYSYVKITCSIKQCKHLSGIQWRMLILLIKILSHATVMHEHTAPNHAVLTCSVQLQFSIHCRMFICTYSKCYMMFVFLNQEFRIRMLTLGSCIGHETTTHANQCFCGTLHFLCIVTSCTYCVQICLDMK